MELRRQTRRALIGAIYTGAEPSLDLHHYGLTTELVHARCAQVCVRVRRCLRAPAHCHACWRPQISAAPTLTRIDLRANRLQVCRTYRVRSAAARCGCAPGTHAHTRAHSHAPTIGGASTVRWRCGAVQPAAVAALAKAIAGAGSICEVDLAHNVLGRAPMPAVSSLIEVRPHATVHLEHLQYSLGCIRAFMLAGDDVAHCA